MQKAKFLTAVLVMSLSGLVACSSGQHHANAKANNADCGGKVCDDKAWMEKAMKLASPGENHAYLEPIIGRWNFNLQHWMEPGAQPQSSKGTSNNKWIMGKRFVQAEVKGTAMGHPFEGMEIVGYDNIKREYNSVWVDNMATGIMTGTAQYNPTAKTFTEQGSFSCPLSGETKKGYRSVWKLIDKNHYTYEMFFRGQDNKEFKTMEIAYKRAGTK